MTATIKCTCAHKAQDEFYGVGFRLMNATLKEIKDKSIPVVFRCTVCLAERRQNSGSTETTATKKNGKK